MSKPKVSVIVPIYNIEKYLSRCIESLVSQTLDDIEIILVNDASPDNCKYIMQAYQERYPDKIKTITLNENQCQGGARNAGIREASADWIGFVDGDDFVLPDMYKTLWEKAIETNADYVCIQTCAVDESGKVLNDGKPYISWNPELNAISNQTLKDSDKEKLMLYSVGGVWSRLWKKDLITSSGVYFPVKRRYEDNYWSSMIVPYINKVVFLEKICYCYRQTDSSTVHAMNQDYHFDRIYIEEKLQDDFRKAGFYQTYRDALEYICVTRYFSNTYDVLTEKFDAVDWKYISRIKSYLKSCYPKWQKNRYVKETLSKKQVLKIRLKYLAPKLFYNAIRISRSIRANIRKHR